MSSVVREVQSKTGIRYRDQLSVIAKNGKKLITIVLTRMKSH